MAHNATLKNICYTCIVFFQGHYSITKGAMFLGMGSKSVVKVETDERGIMKADDLERLLVRDKANVGIFINNWMWN